MKTILLILITFLSGCVNKVYDEKANAQAKTQCPIGYHLKRTDGVVLFANGMDKNKHAVEYRCVVDTAKDSDKKYGVGH